jgi:biotin carboxylase
MSKVSHYALFSRCNLATPKYFVLRSDCGLKEIEGRLQERNMKFPILLKPNSGGFGKGIVRFDNMESLTSSFSVESDDIKDAFGSDGIALLQEFIQPKDNLIYRAWFVEGKVHRAVSVTVDDASSGRQDDDKTKQDFNACVCSVPFENYECPDTVKNNVEALAAAAGADCGSVEYLYDFDGNLQFFDFNCLSTLPDDVAYDELARFIVGAGSRSRT